MRPIPIKDLAAALLECLRKAEGKPIHPGKRGSAPFTRAKAWVIGPAIRIKLHPNATTEDLSQAEAQRWLLWMLRGKYGHPFYAEQDSSE